MVSEQRSSDPRVEHLESKMGEMRQMLTLIHQQMEQLNCASASNQVPQASLQFSKSPSTFESHLILESTATKLAKEVTLECFLNILEMRNQKIGLL